MSNELKKIMRKQMPDMSHVQPPTKHAVKAMIKNLNSLPKQKSRTEKHQRDNGVFS